MGRRILASAGTVAAALVLSLSATAGRLDAVHGIIAKLSGSSIVVQAPNGVVTSCEINSRSLPRNSFDVGDRVLATCREDAAHDILVDIRHAAVESPGLSGSAGEPVIFEGRLTRHSSTSISLRNKNKSLSCQVDDSSPATTSYAINQLARVGCAHGLLLAIMPAPGQ